MTPGEQLHADPVTGESSTPQQRSQAALAHALTFGGFIVPFCNIIAPLIIMVVDKGPGNFVKDHARESLNFQITMMIVSVFTVTMSFFLIGLPFLCAQFIFEVVVIIKAAIAANEGKSYLYPLCIRLLT